MKRRCADCRNSHDQGGHLWCRLNPVPENVGPEHWCSHFRRDQPWGTGVTEESVDEMLAGLDDRAIARAAIWALRRLERL